MARSEESTSAIGQPLIAERGQHGLLHVAAEMVGSRADKQVDFQREELRRPNFEIVADESIAFQELRNSLRERGREPHDAFGLVDQVGRISRQDANECRVPAAGPAEDRHGAQHLRHELGRARIIGFGDGAELHGAECLGRPLLDFGDGFRIDAVARRQWIANERHARERPVGCHVRERLGAHIAGEPIADAIGGGDRGRASDGLAVLVVAETQDGTQIVVDLGHKGGVEGRAFQEIRERRPQIGSGWRGDEQRYRRLRLGDVAREIAARRGDPAGRRIVLNGSRLHLLGQRPVGKTRPHRAREREALLGSEPVIGQNDVAAQHRDVVDQLAAGKLRRDAERAFELVRGAPAHM